MEKAWKKVNAEGKRRLDTLNYWKCKWHGDINDSIRNINQTMTGQKNNKEKSRTEKSLQEVC